MSQQPAAQQRRKVLTEEEYNEGLAQVVQRNYFPDLPHLAETAALHERRAAGDVAGAVAIRRAMRKRQDDLEREIVEQAAAEQDVAVRSTPRPLHHESLTNFHARVTSEDNAEFAEQQDKEIEANRKRQRLEYGRWARITRGTSSSNDAIQALPPSNSYVASPLPLASDQFNATPHRKSIQQFAQEVENSQANPLFFLPNSSSGGAKDSQTLALPPSSTTRNASQNPTMPPPSAKGARNQLSSLAALVEYIPTEDDRKKRIEPTATRFPSVSTSSVLARYHGNGGLNLEESESEGERSISYNSSTDASTDLDAPPMLDLATERRLGKRRKQKEVETMVQMTPVIVPGKSLTDGSDEPLMTWGEVSATPLVLAGGDHDNDDDDDEPSFGVSESARDKAAERARQHMEQRSRLASATPRRKKSLKPPPSLFGSRPTSARSASSFGTALRSSYTPLVAGSKSRSSSIRHSAAQSSHMNRATPKLRPGTRQSSSTNPGNSKDMTKGLLQLS